MREDTIPADPNSPQPSWLRGREWRGAAAPTGSSGSLGSLQLSVGGHAPRTLGFGPLFLTRRRGVIPHPHPFPGPGWALRAGLASCAPAKGAAGNSSCCSLRCPARSSGCESGVGVRVSPVPSVPLQRRPPHLHSRVRAAQHSPWASSAERQSRAAPPRPDIPGAMAEAGAVGGRGGNSRRRRLGSRLGLVTSHSGWPWRPAVSVEALGARECNSGTL